MKSRRAISVLCAVAVLSAGCASEPDPLDTTAASTETADAADTNAGGDDPDASSEAIADLDDAATERTVVVTDNADVADVADDDSVGALSAPTIEPREPIAPVDSAAALMVANVALARAAWAETVATQRAAQPLDPVGYEFTLRTSGEGEQAELRVTVLGDEVVDRSATPGSTNQNVITIDELFDELEIVAATGELVGFIDRGDGPIYLQADVFVDGDLFSVEVSDLAFE